MCRALDMERVSTGVAMDCVPCLPGDLCLGCTCSHVLPRTTSSLALQQHSSLPKDTDRVSVHSELRSCHRARAEEDELCSLSLQSSCFREHANIGADCGSPLPLSTVKMQ